MELNIKTILMVIFIIFLINLFSKNKLENFKNDNQKIICNCNIEKFTEESTNSVNDDDDKKLKGIDEINFDAIYENEDKDKDKDEDYNDNK